jgi:hypothetical protein
MKPAIPRLGLLLGAAVAVAACSSYPKQTDAERLAMYRAHAGQPVRDFQILGSSLVGWAPLGDSALAVWTRPNQAYLLDLFGPCLDLDYAPAISLSNMMGRVSARFDSVYVHGGMRNPTRMPCRIDAIRPLDVKALKQAEKDLREADPVEREKEAAAQPSGT